jgi:hypothetical protein
MRGLKPDKAHQRRELADALARYSGQVMVYPPGVARAHETKISAPSGPKPRAWVRRRPSLGREPNISALLRSIGPARTRQRPRYRHVRARLP